MNKIKIIFIIYYLLINNILNSIQYIININETIIETSYYSLINNNNNYNLKGCNSTIYIKLEYELNEDHLHYISSLNQNISLKSKIIFINSNYTIFKLYGYNTNIGTTLLNLNASNTNNSINRIFSNNLKLNCFEPPKNLTTIIKYENLIPINRNSKYLFQIALDFGKFDYNLNLDFSINDTSFSLIYDKITNLKYILKFKINNPSTIQDNPNILITPYTLNNNNSSYKSFIISPLIKKSKIFDYLNISFYQSNNEKYSYILFNILNDNNNNINNIIPTINNNLTNILSTTYPIYQNNNTLFIGYIKNRKNQFSYLNETIEIKLLGNSDENENINSTIIFQSNGKNKNKIEPVISGSFTNLPYPYGGVTGPFISTLEFTLDGSNNNTILIEFPKHYSIQSIFNWHYIRNKDYIPLWSIQSYIPTSKLLVFKHDMFIPENYFDDTENNQDYYRMVSFYDDNDNNNNKNYQNISFGQIQNQLPPSDKTSPIIKDIELINSNSEFGYILRFYIQQDESTYGFSFLIINDHLIISASSMVSDDGIVETIVNETLVISMKNSFKIKICDTIYNCQDTKYYPKTFNQLNYNPFPSLKLPNYNIISIFDIELLYFNSKSINISTTATMKNIIYLKVNTSITNYPIYFKFNQNSNQFKWSQSLNLYQCTFKLPKNYLTGNLNYYIILNDKEYSYSSLYSIFGENSTLDIQSNGIIDIAPPLVSNITTIPNINYIVNQNNSNDNIFGWDIYIEDQANGFEYGEINITSLIDPIGYSFKFNSNDLINGSIYQIRINLSGSGNSNDIKCISQTYKIHSVYLRDKEGYETSNSSENAISALFKVSDSNQLSISLNCPIIDQPDITVPELTEFILSSNSYDYSNPNSFINVTFTVQDDHISFTRKPLVIFEDNFGNIFIGCNSSNNLQIVNFNINSIRYLCTVNDFPFGFGYPNFATISIYSIYDDFMNVAGYGPMSITNKFDLDTTIKMVFSSFNPIISSSSAIYSNDGNNLIITLNGAYFGTNSDIVDYTILNLNETNQANSKGDNSNSSNENNNLTFKVEFFSGTKIIININIRSIEIKNLQISFSINGQSSNIYQYILSDKTNDNKSSYSIESSISSNDNSISTSNNSINSSSSSNSIYLPITNLPITNIPIINNNSNSNDLLVNFDCSNVNNCSGIKQGQCIGKNKCKCINGWIGIQCNSKPLPGVKIFYDKSKPIATFKQNDIYKLLSLISLYELRELNITGNKIKVFDLQQDWIGKKITNLNSSDVYLYSIEIPETNTLIQSILSIYNQQSIFTFANQTYDINPNSIKFTINISNYNFQSPLNTLELVIQAKFNTTQANNICSKKQATIADGSDLLSIQLNDKSLYCRFLDSAIIDGTRIINVTHENRNDQFNVTLSSTSGQYYYGIELPQFKNNISIDPDFSLLLENSLITKNINNSTCTNHKPKLSNGAIAGIVVGGFGFIAVCIIIIISILFRKYRFSNFTMSLRKWNSNRRSSKSFNLKKI